MYTINCKGKLLLLDKPLVMGVVNATPDSFYKADLNSDMVQLAKQMHDDGAAVIDIGGQSTRPGSESIPVEEELKRVIPLIETIHHFHPGILLSIDTYSSQVAAAAVKAGASLVNDISGGMMDKEMLSTVASLKVPYICMHMKGIPATMHMKPVYEDVVKDVLDFFIERIAACREAGIHDVIVDPGFGFGKTHEHNFRLLHELGIFHILERPILVGLSRKSTIYKTLGTTADQALNGTTVMNTIALLNGASFLRVHDVKEAREAIALVEAYKKASPFE